MKYTIEQITMATNMMEHGAPVACISYQTPAAIAQGKKIARETLTTSAKEYREMAEEQTSEEIKNYLTKTAEYWESLIN
jgi:alcohol dehydrogenase YqhD (iron-dependent ADH family)